MTVVPSGTLIVRPSMVTSDMHGSLPALNVFTRPDIFVELGTELRDVRLDRPGRCVREYADRLALHVVRDFEEIVQILDSAAAIADPVQDAIDPARAFAAGRALSAGLM